LCRPPSRPLTRILTRDGRIGPYPQKSSYGNGLSQGQRMRTEYSADRFGFAAVEAVCCGQRSDGATCDLGRRTPAAGRDGSELKRMVQRVPLFSAQRNGLNALKTTFGDACVSTFLDAQPERLHSDQAPTVNVPARLKCHHMCKAEMTLAAGDAWPWNGASDSGEREAVLRWSHSAVGAARTCAIDGTLSAHPVPRHCSGTAGVVDRRACGLADTTPAALARTPVPRPAACFRTIAPGIGRGGQLP
jgi:hypothetical protein